MALTHMLHKENREGAEVTAAPAHQLGPEFCGHSAALSEQAAGEASGPADATALPKGSGDHLCLKGGGQRGETGERGFDCGREAAQPGSSAAGERAGEKTKRGALRTMRALSVGAPGSPGAAAHQYCTSPPASSLWRYASSGSTAAPVASCTPRARNSSPGG